MQKNTKLLLGVGVLAAAGYLIWKQGQKPKASFVSRMAPSMFDVVSSCEGWTGKMVTIPNSPCANGCYDCCKQGVITPNQPSQRCVVPKQQQA